MRPPRAAVANSARQLRQRAFLRQRQHAARIVDVQSGTFDDPDLVPVAVHIQTAERIGWMERAHELPAFERYPPQA